MKLIIVAIVVLATIATIAGRVLRNTRPKDLARAKKWDSFLLTNLLSHPAVLKGVVIGRGGRVWGKDRVGFKNRESYRLFRLCVKPLEAVGKTFILDKKRFQVTDAWAGVFHAKGPEGYLACGDARTLAFVVLYKDPRAKETIDSLVRKTSTLAQNQGA